MKKMGLKDTPLLKENFMRTRTKLVPGAAVSKDDPMCPVSGNLIARALQILDQLQILNERSFFTDAEISAITGHHKITRSAIVKSMDTGEPIMMPADHLYEIADYVLEAGRILMDHNYAGTGHGIGQFRQLKLLLQQAFYEGIAGQPVAPSPASP